MNYKAVIAFFIHYFIVTISHFSKRLYLSNIKIRYDLSSLPKRLIQRIFTESSTVYKKTNYSAGSLLKTRKSRS